MRQILKNKKGQGLNTVKAFVISVFILAIIAFATVIALLELNDTSVATTETELIVNNVTEGVNELFGNATTWFSLLAVMIIILIIGLVIFVVNRFGGSQTTGL